MPSQVCVSERLMVCKDLRLAERRYLEPGEASWAGSPQACA